MTQFRRVAGSRPDDVVPGAGSGGRLLIVVGMHRAGTSAVARALPVLGIPLGDELVGAGEDNPRGYFEDAAVREINDRLLSRLGLDWFSVRPVPPEALAASGLEDLLAEAAGLIAARLEGNQGRWGFKDPRAARLLPFWLAAAARAGVRPDLLVALRHPVAVAASLMSRNGIPPDQAGALWLEHYLPAAEAADGLTRAWIDYDELLADPRRVVGRAAAVLGLQAEGEELEAYAGEFLDPALRHARAACREERMAGVAGLAAELYRELRSGNTGGEVAGRFRRALADFAPTLAYLEGLGESLRRIERGTEERLRAAETELGRLQAETTRASRELQQLGSALGERDRRIAELEQRALEATRLAARNEEIARQRDEQIRDLQRQLEAASAAVQAAAEETRRRDQEVLRQQQVIEEASGELQELRARLDKLRARHRRELALQEGELERLQALLSEREQERARLADALEAARAAAAQAGGDAEAARRERDQAQATVETLQAQLAERERQLQRVYEWLDRERYSVLRPIGRRVYRRAAMMALGLPAPLTQGLRSLKRRVYPAPVPLQLQRGLSPMPVAAADAEAGPSPAALFDVPEETVLSARHERADVLVFPVIDWHFRIQRPQHLARAMAGAGHRVFYLDTTFEEAAEPGFRIHETPAPGVFLCRLRLPGPHPRIYEDVADPRQLADLTGALRRLIHACGLGPVVSIVDLPFWRPVATALRDNLVVYDCMDHHAGFSTNTEAMLEEEHRLLAEADLVVTTSRNLSEKVAAERDNVLIRNAAEVGFFARRPETLALSAERPVVGYFGAISEWFDMDLVVAAARARPDWDFVLVGSTYLCDTTAAEAQPNIRLVGEVPYETLPGWLHAFDVCLIPFRLTELTRCTNPVKIYEYLAAGKPVVATPLPELEEIGDMLHLAGEPEAFVRALDAAMAEAGDEALRERRAAWARDHDWSSRAGQLDRAIREQYPAVSVVVLTYNNLEFTRACLDSIESLSHYPDLELVVVDNASTDGSREWLQSWAEDREGVRLILNDENLGFAAGNNVGLAAASGDYLVILNNDTYVTPGWVHGLVRHLRRDPGIGLVGPVTNNIGNEARIDIHYADMGEMLERSWDHTAAHARELLDNGRVAFFCVAMPRAVYEAVGPLDEGFGVGFFEDDDYCNRVREAGYRVVIAEDVFVHHHLSATFEKLDQEQRQALFEANKARYERRWGPWEPHKYRDTA